jgi:hypothetical protein
MNSKLVNSYRLNSFTFDVQKRKFPYIRSIGDFVDKEIPSFKRIWPLLGAYTINEAWAKGLNEDLEFIGIAHYTILKSLCYIIRNKDFVIMNDPEQKYKNVVFHYAVIIDCIKQIAFYIHKFKNNLDPSEELPIKRLDKEAFILKMEKDYKSYSKQFDRFEKEGGLVMLIPHNTDPFIKNLNMEGKFNSFISFRDKIMPLRNAFIHNPSIDIFIKEGSYKVVKSNSIKVGRSIQNINKLAGEDLIAPSVFMDDLFQHGTEMLSNVWDEFFKQIYSINKHPNFKRERCPQK